mmetsp:Transcript_57700/g.134979  ORF Transcript_57700/g.134979 Transcript_57700/m.134979 type:complete len:175 (-) Transcript_57700:67-591(-)
MALPEYKLATLRFVYQSKLRKELQYSMQNLRQTLEWSNESRKWPLPQRLPRRAFRATYLRAPFKGKITAKQYVFHDYRYHFTFRDVENVQSTLSTVLGSMTSETSCVCHMYWHYPGLEQLYQQGLSTDELKKRILDLEKGLKAVEEKQHDDIERQKPAFAHSLYWNYGFKRGPV